MKGWLPMAKKVNPYDISAVAEELQKYSEEVTDKVKQAVDELHRNWLII